MSSLPRQCLVLTRAALAGVPRRLALSLSMVLSIALVVAVLIGFLAMAAGLQRTLATGGADDVAVVLGGGTSQEIASSVPPEAARSLLAAGAAAGIALDGSGRPMLSRELVVPVEAAGPDGSARTVSFRGMEAAGPALHGGVTIAEGHPFAPGSREILIGRTLARDLGIAAPGRRLRLGPVDWTIAGIVAAQGGAAESEIWGDLDAVRAAFDRQGEIQSLRVRLDGPDGLAALRTALRSAATTPLDAMTEADFLGRQSAPVTRLITLFGWPIALLMAVGASAGALNTMMSSVADRRAEIATLRVLGFSRTAAFTATFAEAIALSVAGALFGAVGCALLLDGLNASTLGTGGTAITFQLAVTPGVVLEAGLVALLIGGLGGALPALAATRLPLVEALKAGS
ncbi:ABC transporter permease [Segnochrobactrum spirostomi]|uniref:ABC transporter permease n=1 Tax=Segnochrobactrum spirostomi TaxID=2608987 RepID=UPI001AD80E55|nr:ABC transporter permease [Segnochrobactrum spirostomi]